MAPEQIYFAALALVVAPCMGINPMAVLIAGLWAFGQPLYLWSGIPNAADWIDVTLDLVGLLADMVIASKDDRHLLAALAFAPMFAVHFCALTGNVTPVDAWWMIYGLAFFQIGAMLSGNDWPRVEWFWRKAFA